MNFSFKESRNGDPMLAIKTNQQLEVEFLFDKGDDATHVYVNGNEFASHEEVLYGLFVGIGDKVVSLRDLCHEAGFAFPAIKAEVDREGREAAAHERRMSSPQYTDRI